MPRNPSGVYSLPGGSTVANGDTSDASDINTPFADLEADMNTARPVVAGGTGASSASAARTNLGVAIGSDVQAYDAQLDTLAALTAGQTGNLTDIAALTPTNGNFMVGNGTGWVAESGATARTSLGLGSLATANTINNANWSGTDLAVSNGGTGASDASGARSNLGVAIGSDVQAHDAQLDDIAALAVTNGNFMVGNGTGWVAESGATARASLGLGSLATASSVNNSNWSGTDLAVANGGTGASDASTARSNLGLGSIATQAATSVNIDGGAIDGAVIGANSAAAGNFTNIRASSSVGLGSTTVSSNYSLTIQSGSADSTRLTRYSSGIAEIRNHGGTLQVVVDDGAATIFSQNSGETMRINGAGDVGIGTNIPEAKLHVKSGTGMAYDWSSTSSGILIEASGSLGNTHPLIIQTGKSIDALKFSDNGNLYIHGALSKGSGSFKIDHPLPAKTDTHHLVHSFIEGPQADLIYRGTADLVDGAVTVNIDAAAGMTAGTFEALCREPQVWVQNNSGWTQVRGSVTGATLSIEAQDGDCTDAVSWLVIAERCDPHMMATDWTDESGRVIVEPEKASAA